DDEARVAVVLPTGPEFVATFLGALLAGAAPVPIAPSAAFADPAAYRDHVAGSLRAAAPAVLVTAPEQLPSLRGTGCRTATFDALLRSGEAPARGPARRPGALGLLQFTSGSSGRPRGVRVPLAALEHNVRAIRDWLGMTAGDAAASWLPVHHDLGLVGCLLTPIASGGDLWLMRPADFVRSPRRYLRCFGSPGARLTAMPSFGLEHVARRIRPEDLAGLDLGEWRALIVGAERLQADVFERFCRVLAPAGFRPAALLPAYGLAEATLAVTGL